MNFRNNYQKIVLWTIGLGIVGAVSYNAVAQQAASTAANSSKPSLQEVLQQKQRQDRLNDLMQYTGIEDLMMRIYQAYLKRFQSSMPHVSSTSWDVFQENIDFSKLKSEIAQSFQKYLTEDDINNIHKFYQSPSGQRLSAVWEKIQSEARYASKEHSKEMIQNLIRQIQTGNVPQKQYSSNSPDINNRDANLRQNAGEKTRSYMRDEPIERPKNKPVKTYSYPQND